INTIDTSLTTSWSTLASNESGATYQWLDCDDSFSAVSDETGMSFTPSISGNFAVLITKNGCTDTSACFSFQISGINDVEFNKELLIHPNPCSGFVQILNAELEMLNEIKIFDLFGRRVPFNIEHSTLNIEHLPQGIYFVRVGEKVLKMVKE
ncbi:MAG: T9SS type A sorting domain-containing protein, partial [Bacteroidetes bacterium]|nr:T9SS type A sorting domain-containing protein [Bacteroidota bacterium]